MATYHVISPFTDLRENPFLQGLRGKMESQLVLGETFVAEREENGWAYGACQHDGYKGWIKRADLGAPQNHTHVVTAARSDVYAEATMKSARLGTLSFGSRISVIESGEKFSNLSSGGWIYNSHIEKTAANKTDIKGDIITQAKKFLETPYYWGGRSGFGLDCSGLVQICAAAVNIALPRDCDQQESAAGEAVSAARTGDLVYFKGHVGIMVDDENILHANAHHMKVTIEPLWKVEERGGGITSIRRI